MIFLKGKHRWGQVFSYIVSTIVDIVCFNRLEIYITYSGVLRSSNYTVTGLYKRASWYSFP